MNNVAKINTAKVEATHRGFEPKNILLSKKAHQMIIREISGGDLDVTLATLCGLDVCVTDAIPDTYGILRYCRSPNAYGFPAWWLEPVGVVEFDL